MDNYHVKLLSHALEQIEHIYAYITGELKAKPAAEKLAQELEKAIFSLEAMPYRYPKRRTGAYADRGYRQVFVGNFTIVYRVDEANKEVIIVTVRYSRSSF